MVDTAPGSDTDLRPSASARHSHSRQPGAADGWRWRVTVYAVRLACIVVVLVLWQVFAGGPRSVLPADAVSRPTAIWSAFWQLASSGQLASGLAATGVAVLYALLIAAPLGVLLAALTLVRPVRWILEPVVTIAYAIPNVSLITIFILALGVSVRAHVALVVSAALFVYYFSARQAILEVEREKVESLRMMGANPLKIARLLVLPSAVTYLLSATRIAFPLAFGVEIFAELRITTTNGLGVILANIQQVPNPGRGMAVLLVIVIIAYLLDVIIGGRVTAYLRSIGKGEITDGRIRR